MIEFDHGPLSAFANHFAAVPVPQHPERFWYDWGPIFYRGRLNSTARVLCIASDPGPTERIAGRVLVGDAGQRVQGFLSKLGLTSSYVCLNAFPWALFPSQANTAESMLAEPEQLKWRNRLYDMAHTSSVQAVVAFGGVAQDALHAWPGKAGLAIEEIPHPSSHDETILLDAWRGAVTRLRAVVSPDADGDPALPNYGTVLTEADYAAIPRRDLPFGVPAFLGDDAWKRAQGGRGTVFRPSPDDHHTLQWVAPTS